MGDKMLLNDANIEIFFPEFVHWKMKSDIYNRGDNDEI